MMSVNALTKYILEVIAFIFPLFYFQFGKENSTVVLLMAAFPIFSGYDLVFSYNNLFPEAGYIIGSFFINLPSDVRT